MHVGWRAKFKLVLCAGIQFLTTNAIDEANTTATSPAIKNKTPRPEGSRGLIKTTKKGSLPA
ncbi:MAG: hypothetical protein EBU32_09220 [Opitutaceae bacterium]|nr:hypothetical protein [Opitutaceae bacterium]